MTDNLYITYYSIGALIVTIVAMFFAGFFVMLPKKSPASLHFGIAMVIYSVFNTSYIFPFSYYSPIFAWHRIGTYFTILPTIIHLGMFLFNFPRPTHRKYALIYFRLFYAIAILLAVYFIIEVRHSGIYFASYAHYYELDIEHVGRFQSFFILAALLLAAAAGIVRSFSFEGRDRLGLLAQSLTLIFVLGIPAALNTISREGMIRRDVFQTWYSLTITIGLFIMIVIYLNSTRDKTSFMTKIVGISLVTFLVFMQIISYRFLRQKEQSYEVLKKQQVELAVHEKKPIADMVVLARSGPGGIIRVAGRNMAFPPEFAGEIHLSALFEGQPGNARPSGSLLPGQAAVEKILLSRGKRNPLLEEMLLRGRLKIQRNKPEGALKEAAKIAEKYGTAFPEYTGELKSFLQSEKNHDAAFKTRLLAFFPQKRNAAEHTYYEDEKTGEHFTVFIRQQIEGTEFALFPYRGYRQFIHGMAAEIFIITIIVTAIIVLIFPLFFYLALVEPLSQLLSGVEKVNGGDLNVQVKIRVEDEIGFLARSFNGMVTSISQATEKLKDYAENLEEKVTERTRDLENSLHEIRTLKKQQDGDYFLTSLLLRPLEQNQSAGGRVNADFFIRQKKKFEFREKKAEIGGDLCIARRIRLRGRVYLAVVNGDAMGKSMQGAGGAIVLGSLFHAIIERTLLSPEMSSDSPERWLRSAFVEIHRIFEVFDGSMLVSAFMALVDEESGTVYYMNAEHPWAVLFRDGKASFIENEFTFRKLGTVTPDQDRKKWRELRRDVPLFVSLFRLQPGDCLILGSDGRDDIRFAGGPEELLMNEDETLFLRVLEEAGGNLEKCHDLLRDKGEITDDLSLVRLEFEQGNPVPDNGSQRAKIKSLLRRGDFAEAAKLLPEYTAQAPADSIALWWLSFTLSKIRRYREAAEAGERLRLRNPTDARNLYHLASVHARAGNRQRAFELVVDLLEFEPGHSKGMRLLEKLEKA